MEPSNENEVACEPLAPPDKVGTGSRTPPPTSSAEVGRSGSGLCDNNASEIEKKIRLQPSLKYHVTKYVGKNILLA